MIKKKITIYVAGSFDLFHFGHLNILLKAKKLGDYLIVGVSTDKLIKKYKKIKPVINYILIGITSFLNCFDMFII